jgi:hypothetical protein
MCSYYGMRILCAPAEKPPVSDIVDRKINALAQSADGLGGCTWTSAGLNPALDGMTPACNGIALVPDGMLLASNGLQLARNRAASPLTGRIANA